MWSTIHQLPGLLGAVSFWVGAHTPDHVAVQAGCRALWPVNSQSRSCLPDCAVHGLQHPAPFLHLLLIAHIYAHPCTVQGALLQVYLPTTMWYQGITTQGGAWCRSGSSSWEFILDLSNEHGGGHRPAACALLCGLKPLCVHQLLMQGTCQLWLKVALHAACGTPCGDAAWAHTHLHRPQEGQELLWIVWSPSVPGSVGSVLLCKQPERAGHGAPC
jgi:hypothetical protein